jgi:hypothetical protein
VYLVMGEMPAIRGRLHTGDDPPPLPIGIPPTFSARSSATSACRQASLGLRRMVSTPMRVFPVVIVLGFAGLLAVDLEPSAAPRGAAAATARGTAPEPSTVTVAFLRDGRPTRVRRIVPRGRSAAMEALRQLLAGPTRYERRQGIRTSIPEGVRVRSLRSDEGDWLVSFSRSLLVGGSPRTKQHRLAQISATLGALGTRRFAAVATEGRLVTTLRLGVWPGRWVAATGEKDYLYVVRGVQLRLWRLGYLDRTDVSGTLDYSTQQALLAFQGWEGLDRTGTVTGQTQVALLRAARPDPAAHRTGRRVEIYRDRGVLLLVEDGEVRRAVHTSTGVGGITPVGVFAVYAKSLMSWSRPFRVWMPYAAYFRGGIATHQSPDVPSYNASHGCVRLPEGDAERVFRFVEIGTPVRVF